MESTHVDEAVMSLEKANADLEPELLSVPAARRLLETYARAEKLASFGKTVLAHKLDDATEVARVGGTSMGKAKATVETGKVLCDADDLRDAFANGDISVDQASEIVKAEQARPGAAAELVPVATTEAFHVLKERTRKIVLDAEQGRGLASRQHDARSAHSHSDDLGMVHVHLAWEPHVGTPIVTRLEAEAARLHRRATRDGAGTGSDPASTPQAQDACGAQDADASSTTPPRRSSKLCARHRSSHRALSPTRSAQPFARRWPSSVS